MVFGDTLLGKSSKKNKGYFTVRLTVRGGGGVSPLQPDHKNFGKIFFRGKIFWINIALRLASLFLIVPP